MVKDQQIQNIICSALSLDQNLRISAENLFSKLKCILNNWF